MTTLVKNDWIICKLGNCVSEMRNGLQSEQKKENGKYKITRIETIGREFLNLNRVQYSDNISPELAAKFKLKKGDILFSHINSDQHLGKTVLISKDYEDVLHGMNLLLIRTDEQQVTPDFLQYQFRDLRNQGVFIRIASRAVNQSSINQAKLKNLDVIVPPLPEQKDISRVLTTVQDAIAEQEHFIEKLKELKRSMMHHLYTHGTKGEKTKMTEIGEVPESWDVVRLGNVCETSSGGTPSRSNKSYYNGDIPWIKSGEMNDGYISDSEEHITEDAVKNSSTKLFEKGTLLIAMYGATAGKTAILEREATTNQAICAIFKNDDVDLEYIRHALVLQRDFLLDQRHGGAQPNLSQTSIRNLLIPFPSISEQQAIANALVAVETKTWAIQSKLNSYQSLFKTLLHELMSGERRIKV